MNHPNSYTSILSFSIALTNWFSFLLSILCTDLAVAELEFDHPDHASKAENSWKLIASSLQSVLGCNVELRINLSPRNAKSKRSSFSLFSCSRRIHKSQTPESGSDRLSDASNFTSDKAMIGDKHVETCSSCGSQVSHICSHRMVSTIRNSDGNALSTARSGASTPHRISQDSMFSEQEKVCKILTIEEQEEQPKCFPKTMRLSKKEASGDMCLKIQPKENSRQASFDTYICTDYPYVLSNGCNNDISRHEDGWVSYLVLSITLLCFYLLVLTLIFFLNKCLNEV